MRRCILAGTSEHGGCAKCGAPWQRVVAREDKGFADRTFRSPHETGTPGMTNGQGKTTLAKIVERETTGWTPSCACGAHAVPQQVLDPFMGSGTTALVARKLGRRAVGIDLSADYLAIASRRLGQQSLFAQEMGA